MKKINLELNDFPNGVMATWESVENCANYILKLYLRKNENVIDLNRYESEYHFKPDYSLVKMNCIDVINISRNKCYYTISDLAEVKILFGCRIKRYPSYETKIKEYKQGYFLELLAEDKQGKIIAKSDLIAFAPGSSQSTVVVGGKNTVTIG